MPKRHFLLPQALYNIDQPRKPHWRGWLSTVGLRVIKAGYLKEKSLFSVLKAAGLK